MVMDSASFETFYTTHADRVYTTAFRILKDSEAAADVTQDTFIKALRQEALDNPSAWLSTVATNGSLDYLRRSSRQVAIDSDQDDEDRGDVVLVDPAEPSQTASSADQVALVVTLVDELRPEQRAAMVGRYIDELPIETIARSLGKTVNATTVLLSRARAALRDRYADHIFERRGLPAECRALRPQLLAYDSGAPAADDDADHVSSCSHCQETLAELRSMSRAFAAAPMIAAPVAVKTSLLGTATAQGLVATPASAAAAASSTGGVSAGSAATSGGSVVATSAGGGIGVGAAASVGAVISGIVLAGALVVGQGGVAAPTPATTSPAASLQAASEVVARVGGPPVTVSLTATTPTVTISFDATDGQRVAVRGFEGSLGRHGLSLRSPSQAAPPPPDRRLEDWFLDPMILEESGRYGLQVCCADSIEGDLTVQLYDVPPDVTASLDPPGTLVPVELTTFGQSARLSFTAVAGETLSLEGAGNTLGTTAAVGTEPGNPTAVVGISCPGKAPWEGRPGWGADWEVDISDAMPEGECLATISGAPGSVTVRLRRE